MHRLKSHREAGREPGESPHGFAYDALCRCGQAIVGMGEILPTLTFESDIECVVPDEIGVGFGDGHIGVDAVYGDFLRGGGCGDQDR